MNHVMIDNETLAVTADAVILSVGAVQFELDGSGVGETFYRSISIDSNTELGRRIDESTITFWMDDGPKGAGAEARKLFKEAKVGLEAALVDLADWFPADAKVWSNGASFDIPQLDHAYRQLSMETPWKFYDTQCMRTYRNLPGAAAVPRVKPTVAHNALADAIAQAMHLQAIYQALFGKVKVVA